MRNVISETVNKLMEISGQPTMDWDALDRVLKGLDDINIYDDLDGETILSEWIMNGDFYDHGAMLPDIVRHFLACGYDVAAHDGMNGGMALQALC